MPSNRIIRPPLGRSTPEIMVEQRGLAGAVRADHAADLARRHHEADIGDGLAGRQSCLLRFSTPSKRGHDSHRLRRLVVFDVAQALALPQIGDAEVEFLHVLV